MILARCRWLVLSSFVYLGVAACSFTIDVDELENGSCPEGQKLCNKKCVSVMDPESGCASKSCASCYLSYAKTKCGGDGTCQIASCTGDFADCDGKAENGCEKDLAHDVNFCGGCKVSPCTVANGTPICVASRCGIASCKSGFNDCNKSLTDGCEAQVETCSQ